MTETLTVEPDIDLSKPLPYATFSINVSRAAELADQGELIPWQGVLAVEGAPTGDGRVIELGALRWAALPLPLMAQFENPVGGMGHDGAKLAGRIDDIVRIDGNRVWARGMIDPKAPGGPDLIRALDQGTMRGVSVDLDDITVTQFRDDNGRPRRAITDGRVRGATATPFQAIVEAEISLDTEALAEALVASAPAVGMCARITTPISPEEILIERRNTLVASGKVPVDPPLAWFEKRTFTELTPFTITPNGQVFGHIAAWGTCHISFRRCEPVPRSSTNYSEFRTGTVITAEGEEVRTGPLIMDSVHPDLMMRASDAQAFYAHTGSAVADIVPYEDKFGIAVVGAIRPDVTPEQLRALRGSDISPDWRTVNGRHRECVAMLAVNNSGFKVPQTLVASAGKPKRFVLPGGVAAALDPDGELLSLVAAGGALDLAAGGCEDDGDPLDQEPGVDRDAMLSAIIERFGPKVRTFRRATPPAVRTFRMSEFHGSHNQKDHGNWACPGCGEVMPNTEKARNTHVRQPGHGPLPIPKMSPDTRALVDEIHNEEKPPRKPGSLTDDDVYVPTDAQIRKGRKALDAQIREARKTNPDSPLAHSYTEEESKVAVELERNRRLINEERARSGEPELPSNWGEDYLAKRLQEIRARDMSTRRFRVASSAAMDGMFHAQHNQKDHGNRYGGSSYDPETPAGYQDADIEARGLEASANAANAVMSPGGGALDTKARSRAAQSAADAAYYGGSLWDATTNAIADTGKKVSPEEFEEIMLEASGILHSRTEKERRYRRRR